MLNEIRAILFDMDGSLVDSMWIWTEVDKKYMEKYHLTEPDTLHKDIEGMSFVETAQYFLDTFPTLTCTREEVCREWTEMTIELYQTQVQLKPGAREFLRRMREQGVLLGIATSNTKELALAVLEALGVRSYFSAVCTANEVPRGKPEPDVYLLAARELQVDPGNCLVFEDLPNGIRAGKSAGMKVCAVHDLFSVPQEAEKRRLADYYIRDYEEIWTNRFDICGE